MWLHTVISGFVYSNIQLFEQLLKVLVEVESVRKIDWIKISFSQWQEKQV